MSAEERGRSSYLDLLVTTLMEHEKSMDNLVNRLEKIVGELSAIREEAASREKREAAERKRAGAAVSGQDALVYIRIPLGRPIDETVKIVESLKK